MERKRKLPSNSSQPSKQICVNYSFLHPSTCRERPCDFIIMKNQLKSKKHLLEKVDAENSCTPLLSATKMGHISCTRFLLSKGANVNAKNSDNHSAFQIGLAYLLATENTVYLEIVRMVKEYDCKTPAIRFESLRNKKYVDYLNNEIIIGYIEENDIQRLKFLYECGFRFNHFFPYQNCTVTYLHFAIKYDKPEVINFLILHGVPMSTNANTSYDNVKCYLLSAMEEGHLGALKELLKHGVTLKLIPRNPGYRPLARNIERMDDLSPLVKIQISKMMYSFGFKLFDHGRRYRMIYRFEDEEDPLEPFYEQVNKLQRSPRCLKCISRIAVLKHYKHKLPLSSQQFEIPQTLRHFLLFPDAGHLLCDEW